MDFLDDAKLEQAKQAKAEEEQRLKNKEWSKVIIPDDLAAQIAENIYIAMKNKLLLQCLNKGSYVISDKKTLGDNCDYQYEIGIPQSSSDHRTTIYKWSSPFNLSPGIWSITPANNGFFDGDGGRIYYRNDESLVKVFTLLINKFKKQNIKYVFRYEYPPNETVLVFYVIIPCDKDGNII